MQIAPVFPGLRRLAVALFGFSLVTTAVAADRAGLHSTSRNASVNKNTNVNVNKNTNVNVNKNVNVNVHKSVDVNVHHSGGYYHNDNHGNFWGGVAAGLVIGAVIHSPPPHPQTVVVQNVTYIVSDGVYYQVNGASYVVVNPPAGVVVTAYPAGAVHVVVGGQVYYHYNGLYYRPAMQNGVTVYTTVRF